MTMLENQHPYPYTLSPPSESVWTRYKYWATYLVALLLYALFFAVWQHQEMPWNVYFMGLVIAAVAAFPLALWYTRDRDTLPVFELICIFYGINYGLSLYLQRNQVRLANGMIMRLPYGATLETLILVLLGMVMLIAFFYLSRSYLKTFKLPRIDLPFDPRRRMVYVVGALILGLAVAALRSADILPRTNSSVGAFITLMANQSQIAIIVLAYYVYQEQAHSVGWRMILYAGILASVLIGLTTGMLLHTLLPLALLTVVRWHAFKRIPWEFVIAGFLIFLVLNPIKFQFRSQAWVDGAAPTLGERVAIWLDLGNSVLDNIITGENSPFDQETLLRSASRLDLLHNLVLVHQMTPRFVPYYGGETYSYLIYGWIPRVLWADKPIAQEANNIFAVDYGFLQSRQIGSTMIGIGHIGEAYANFGVLGVLVIMAIQGFTFGFLDYLLNGPRSQGGQALYLSFMIVILNSIGSATSAVFINAVQVTVINTVILRPFALGLSDRRDTSS